MPVCPCDIVRSKYPDSNREIDIYVIVGLQNAGAGPDCVNYLVNNVGKTLGEALPECYGGVPRPLPFQEYLPYLAFGVSALALIGVLWFVRG